MAFRVLGLKNSIITDFIFSLSFAHIDYGKTGTWGTGPQENGNRNTGRTANRQTGKQANRQTGK
jgi:hypothetical protein